MSLPRARRMVMAGWIAAALVASLLAPSSSEARKRKKAEPAPASTAPVAATAVTPPAPAAQAPTPPAPPPAAAALTAEGAPHVATFEVRLAPPARLAGISLTLTYDATRFVAAAPKSAAGLTGYMCQDNLAQPGILRWSCVGLVNEARGGTLATLEVRGRERMPTLSDLVVERLELVDELSRPMTDAKVELAAAASAPAR